MGVQTQDATERMPEHGRDSMETQTVRIGAPSHVGWLRAVAPLWPLGLARILYGILWWQQSKWKVPSDDFGRKSGGGLWYWVQQEIQHPTVNAYRDFLVNVLIPNWTFFGWMTLITETFIGVTPAIAFTPEDERALFARLAPGFTLVPQRGDDLGARLHSTLDELLRRGHAAALAIDSDTPTLPSELLEEAVRILESADVDVVLGPTEDGGYYLVGVRAARRELFDAIPWSTAAVLTTTLAHARTAGLRTVCLPSWFDVDTPADLERLRAALDATAAGAGETRRLLATWRAS